MPVIDGSRYINSVTQRLPDDNGVPQVTLLRSIPENLYQTFQTYTWKSTDRWDQLALALLGDSELYWVILDMNPEVTDPFTVQPGQVIRVPAVTS